MHQSTDHFSVNGRTIDNLTLADCWTWAYSDLTDSMNRSVLAEFILLTESPLTLPLVASLEMTTGVRSVCASTLSQHTKTILSAAAVSFTGLSGIAQTACVLSETGLSVIQYTISRILSAVLCAALCAALFMLLL